MIKNKKGVESFPFFLFLTLLIASIVLVVSFYQINTLKSFSDDRTLTDNYQNLINTMETLRATSDQGSFTKIKFEVPNNYNITFSVENDTISIGGKKDLTNSFEDKFDIVNMTDKYGKPVEEGEKLTLNHGKYELVIYYGKSTSDPEPFEIFFV